MLFRVYGPDGKAKFQTNHVECIPRDYLDNMSASGCKFKFNDKPASAKQIEAELSSNEVPKRVVIRCIETGDIFEKQSEAAKKYNIDPAQVSDSIKTGRKRSGYTFEKVEI